MTTKLHDVVTVDPDGLVRACAWCLTRQRLDDLNRQYAVTHTLCQPCAERFEREVA